MAKKHKLKRRGNFRRIKKRKFHWNNDSKYLWDISRSFKRRSLFAFWSEAFRFGALIHTIEIVTFFRKLSTRYGANRLCDIESLGFTIEAMAHSPMGLWPLGPDHFQPIRPIESRSSESIIIQVKAKVKIDSLVKLSGYKIGYLNNTPCHGCQIESIF